jgi:hypothetical protein
MQESKNVDNPTPENEPNFAPIATKAKPKVSHKRPRKQPPRKGDTARHGGTANMAMLTRYERVKIMNKAVSDHDRKKATKVEPLTQTIAQMYGTEATGDMTSMQSRWKTWEARKDAQRAKSRKPRKRPSKKAGIRAVKTRKTVSK